MKRWCSPSVPGPAAATYATRHASGDQAAPGATADASTGRLYEPPWMTTRSPSSSTSSERPSGDQRGATPSPTSLRCLNRPGWATYTPCGCEYARSEPSGDQLGEVAAAPLA